MLMWMVIVYTITIIVVSALWYLSSRVGKFNWLQSLAKNNSKKLKIISWCLILALLVLTTAVLNLVNAAVCTLYFAMFWAISDLFFYLLKKICRIDFKHYYAGFLAIATSLFSLSVGWYLDHHVWQTIYNLTTAKEIPFLKIVEIADSHTGTTFHADGFAKHMEAVEKENPDIIIVAGDFVDDDTSREDMIKTCQILGNIKTKYGIYFAFGNHDNGYYGPEYRGFSGTELISELEKNKVNVLRDEVVLIDDLFYIIGRRDFSVVKEKKGTRKSMQELVKTIDKSKYMIVIDHQPTDYDNQAKSGVDLVLSGHTHGGQLFPFNQVGKWIGANDLIYGHERRKNTDFIVTSGLSDWAIKFKTGTKSEFVTININKAKMNNENADK